MFQSNKTKAGLLFFAGPTQFILAAIICEALYPGYNLGQQAMSDLGSWTLVGSTAAIFNVSTVLLGITIVAGALLVRKYLKNRFFIGLLIIAGIGNAGVGVVTEDIFGPVHLIFALAFFISWAAAAILSFKFLKSPFSCASAVLGVFSLVAFVVSLLAGKPGSVFNIGIGFGGIERLIVYPLFLWTIGFGGYLLAE
ncbi:MAG: DUF998 domain-containing protein [Candidatus Bathyarchaeia archaeon]|jgi:hypothetical membrane protein